MSKFLCSATRQAFCCVMAVFLLMGCGGGGGGGGTTFTLKIEANPRAGGTVSPSGNIKYPVGTKAEVTATAAKGYRFIGWSGASTDDEESATVTMNSNQALTANFEKLRTMITDSRDGKKYRTVKIGNLTWMSQNLNFKTGNSWCYEDDDGNCQKYGRLYDWTTAKSACPSEWRLPTREDWNDLVKAAGGYVAGEKLKSGSPNWNGTDEFGFSALPGGFRGTGGSFSSAGSNGSWWSATESGSGYAWYRRMGSYGGHVNENNFDKGYGYSVLCVR